MLKAGVISLGCVKNLVDTEVMLGILRENKIDVTAQPNDADIIIINTCTFIESAKEEGISTILQMADFKISGKCRGIIVAGCLGQRYKQELLDELPEVDAIIGTGAWDRIMEAVKAVLAGERLIIADKSEIIYDDKMPRILTTPRYTAYVKVAEGCDNRCAYCVIPLVRGNFRSRTIESIVAETKNLVKNGVKEINLIAQDTTNYGIDLYGEIKILELLKELVKIEDLKWIRLLYCYPKRFTDELLNFMATEPKICKYIDLPLQHAHNDVLKAMARQDTKEEIEDLLLRIRKIMPTATIRTSFIVGFPGESIEHYETLKEFIIKQRFDKVGIFTYSKEEDTVAFTMEQQVSEEIKQERYHELMAIQSKISEEINQSLEDQELEVLIEGRDSEQENVTYGRSYREAQEIDGQVYVENDPDSMPGQFIKTKVVQGYTYDILAEKIK